MVINSLRVAVVDDDIAVCRALARLLRAKGHAVDVYGSGREFLASLDRNVPECLVVDLQMPEMTGLELQRHLADGGFRIPVIVITAHDAARTREQCLLLGASACLIKPLRGDT